MGDDLSADLASLRIDRSGGSEPPRRPGRWIAALLATVAAIATIYLFVLPAVQSRFFKTEIEITEVAVVSPAQASVELTSTGYVIPQRVSQVAAKVPGRVAEVRVVQGQAVKEGDVLLLLETNDQKAAIAAARSRVASARAQVATARANLGEAEQQLRREQKLSAEGVSPAALAEDLERRVDVLRASVKAADANVRSAAAEVAALEVNLENYTLVTPIAGTVLNKPPEVGEMVGPAMAGVASQVGGVEIADFDTLAVETDVPESRLHLVQVGGPAEIILDAYPDRRYRGKAFEIVPKVNRAKATATVKVKFVDDPNGVLPEMAGRVSFLGKELDDASMAEPPKTVVPQAAITERAGAQVVFVVEGDRVRMVPVELGPPFAGGFELVRGPAPGTKLVSGPPEELRDGEQVKEKTDS